MLIDDELKFVTRIEAEKNAKDQEYYLEILGGRVFVYNEMYLDFTNQYETELLKYANNQNSNQFLDNNDIFSFKDLWKLLKFLESGKKLLNQQSQLIVEAFTQYQKFSSTQKIIQWNRLVDFAEEKLNLQGIRDLHHRLQLIIALYEVEGVRIEYFKDILTKTLYEKRRFEFLDKPEALFATSKIYDEQNIYYTQVGV